MFSHAFRSIKRANEHVADQAAAGRVSHLYTFGAPHVSLPALTRRDGSCFDGYRISTFRDDWFVDYEDIVPTLLVPANFYHPNIRTLGITNTSDGFRHLWSCGQNPWRVSYPEYTLHFKSVYEQDMQQLGSQYSRAKEAASIGLANSYSMDPSTVQVSVQSMGWNLVASASIGEDVSHLLQNPNDKRCILTFEGSDSPTDFIADAKIKKVSFCGLAQQVHLGFRDEFRNVTWHSNFQTEIRPKLGQCSTVDVVGHSLGGAVASLFAACVDSQNGSDDYNKVSWSVSAPQALSPVV